MQLGVMFNHVEVGNDPGAIRHHVQSIEGSGADYLTAPEHVIGGHPDRLRGEVVHTYDKPYHEPFVLLGFIAAVTSHLGLGTSVLVLPQRQTALVAKQAAELDVLSGGRVRLGVGVGRNWMEYEALNEDFASRGERLEEQIEVLRLLWTDELVTFEGRWHHLDRMGLNPMPVQRPIPVWMGSYVGKVVEKVVRRVGRLADGWMAQMPPKDEFSAVLERVRGYAADAGRDPASISIEGVVKATASDDPDSWQGPATAFRDRGATHVKVMVTGAATPAEHTSVAVHWLQTVGPLRLSD